MRVGKVIGNIWATRKDTNLSGLKLLIIKPINYLNNDEVSETIIAADIIGAGIGETVIITTGSSARSAIYNPKTPIDAAVIGIVDDKEILGN